MTAPATAKQLEFLALLVEERDWPDVSIPDSLSETEASKLIDHAKTLPKMQRVPAAVGFYLHHDKVYRVRQSKTSEHAYAEVIEIEGIGLRTGRWRLASGMAHRVSVPLTVTEAIRRGRSTSVCHVCGNRLVNDDNGIHFGCAKRLEKW